ncbi:type VII secretion protein EccB [Mycolicibacterium sp. S2-37]|uniref:type VII secretion protein EccB n=1 Tax=Mycolicibacterium sp. S2-37 TaxID=2810297 RepID=UPI001A94CC41|nr:type VII secretion protein EccB [Mycolicibacterium sp. S2-37]MBO0681241.1 type VII secretion protein EccB [Mycolicibacterium sp. S2-37]
MTSPDDRRSFSSRTPASENPERTPYRRGFVTRHQVSGWRFMMRRIASGVALHDTRMLVDPLRTQSRAVLVGALILVTGLAGCFVFSLIRPAGSAGTDTILADRSTAALYVRVGEQLHPVLNLTSARLIAGRADNPTTVKTSELDQFPRGNLVGIPGAPERMVQNSTRDADWTVCEAVSGSSAGVTVLAGAIGTGGERAATLPADRAVLVSNGAGTWLLWNGRRSAVDLANRAVTDALGIPAVDVTPRPIAAGLFNAIPEGPALIAPPLPNAGQPPQFPMPVSAPVGAVVSAFDADDTIRYYAVLPDGLQPVSSVLASILRNTNSYGLAQPPRLAADDIARLPVSGTLDVEAYPAERVSLVDASADPITCAQWAKPADAEQSSLTLLSGAALPLPENLRTLDLVGAGNGVTANRVALAPGSGYFVQTVGQEPGSPIAGSLFWVSDTGVRYGIEQGDSSSPGEDTVAALGLSSPPLPVPWSVLAQFAAGPTLSRGDALLAHDTLQPDPSPVRLENR